MAKQIGTGVWVEGIDELKKRFQRLASVIDSKDMANKIVDAAVTIRDEIKSRAPVVTGNLKRSVVAKKYSRLTKGNPGAFVAIDYRIGPHAHLVEYGHGGSNPAPAHPFFRPGVDNKIDIAERKIKMGVIEVIERAMKR